MRPAPARPVAILLVVLCAAASVAAPAASASDLHRLFETRCAACHGHAGDFARTALRLVDGRLAGRRPGRDLAGFLQRHQGGLTADEAAAVVTMLEQQVGTTPTYRDRCMACHDRAADLARAFLIRRDGVLVGRYTGRPVAGFLAGHGRLDEAEAAAMTALLARVEAEVHGP